LGRAHRPAGAESDADARYGGGDRVVGVDGRARGVPVAAESFARVPARELMAHGRIAERSPTSPKSIASSGVDERYRLVMHPLFRSLMVACAASVMTLAAAGARAGSVFDTVGLLPSSAETVVVVHDGATMRRSAVGRAAIDGVTSLVGF